MVDIIFFGTLTIEIERFLPIMIGLKKKGVRTCLFYQNYDYRDYLKDWFPLIMKHDLFVVDFSWYIHGFTLWAISKLIQKFPHNKLRGLRTKIMKRKVTEKLMLDIFADLQPKMIVMPDMDLNEYREYPYGAYYASRIAKAFGIKRIAMWHGGCGDIDLKRKPENCFDVYLLQNKAQCLEFQGANTVVLGDPAFDKKWKKEVKEFLGERRFVEHTTLYVCSNPEHGDFPGLRKPKGKLLIKPHPRYNDIQPIKNALKKRNIHNYEIVTERIIKYKVDHIMSPFTSALFDMLPEYKDKLELLPSKSTITLKDLKSEKFLKEAQGDGDIIEKYCRFFAEITIPPEQTFDMKEVR